MAEKAFSQIKEAEIQAQSFIKNTQEEANQIIRRAQEETDDAFLSFTEAYRLQRLEWKQQMEATIREASDEFAKETTELCTMLKQQLSARKQDAVDAVIRMIQHK